MNRTIRKLNESKEFGHQLNWVNRKEKPSNFSFSNSGSPMFMKNTNLEHKCNTN